LDGRGYGSFLEAMNQIRAGVRIRVRAYYRQSEMFFSRPIVRAVALTTVVAAVNQYQ
jgi:hypothetical protein